MQARRVIALHFLHLLPPASMPARERPLGSDEDAVEPLSLLAASLSASMAAFFGWRAVMPRAVALLPKRPFLQLCVGMPIICLGTAAAAGVGRGVVPAVENPPRSWSEALARSREAGRVVRAAAGFRMPIFMAATAGLMGGMSFACAGGYAANNRLVLRPGFARSSAVSLCALGSAVGGAVVFPLVANGLYVAYYVPAWTLLALSGVKLEELTWQRGLAD